MQAASWAVDRLLPAEPQPESWRRLSELPRLQADQDTDDEDNNRSNVS